MTSSPLTAQESLDQATARQRLAADPRASVWVSANAGTGKTRVLVDRISRLLLLGVRPEKILCLTFTKAAAAEMENRLSDTLGAWAMMDDDALTAALLELLGSVPHVGDLINARRLFAETLEAPGGLKVRTIHAFCESILARFPIEANIVPHASVMDERTAAEILAEARERVYLLPHLAPAINAIAGTTDEGTFEDVMGELLSKRQRLSHSLYTSGGLEDLIVEIFNFLNLSIGDSVSSLLRNACENDQFDNSALSGAVGALQTGGDSDQKRARVVDNWLRASLDQRCNLIAEYQSLFLTKSGSPKAVSGLITKKPKEAYPAALEALLVEQHRIHDLNDRIKAVSMAHATKHLITIATQMIGEYETLKRQRALLDYDDLILKTLDLLRRDNGASWVHYKLDGGIDHVLVDEAQDTSPEQWDVIKLLAGEFFALEADLTTGAAGSAGAARVELAEQIELAEQAEASPGLPLARSVFAVGDEKQSIYSFQGADPKGFATARDHFEQSAKNAGSQWRNVQLEQSFRTTSAVLDVVDGVFKRTAAQPGVSDENGTRHRATRAGHAGRVELWPAISKSDRTEHGPWDAPVDRMSETNPVIQTAETIAETIDGWLSNGHILPSRDRPINAGDIMILVRKRSQFADEMVRRLKARNIPVAGSDRMALGEQLAVMDLISAARFALLPEDDLNTATVLKGPFIDLSEDALFDLAWDRGDLSIWYTLQQRDKNGPASKALSELLRRADFMPPYEFFTTLLGADRGRAKLVARLGQEANDPIDEFLNQAMNYDREHVPSLEGFLGWLSASETQIKRDMDTSHDKVRVMTVHGSKGLEANIVILPDTCSAPDGRMSDKVLWADNNAHNNALPLWPGIRDNETESCEILRDQVKEAGLEEYRRLLYVAMTRARDQLYVTGWERRNPPKDTEHGRDEGSWYELIRPALEDMNGVERQDDILRVSTPQQDPPGTGDEASIQILPLPLSDQPDWLRAPPPLEPEPSLPLTPSRSLNDNIADEPPVSSPFEGDNTDRFRRGSMIHRLLQTLPDLPPSARDNATRSWLDTTASDLSPEIRAEIASETLNIVQHADFSDIFGPESLAEVAIAGTIETAEGPRTIAGQVDRLCIGESTITIVDYKTNRPPPESEKDVPEIYLSQMALYKSALKHIYPKHHIRCMLVWTHAPRYMILGEL